MAVNMTSYAPKKTDGAANSLHKVNTSTSSGSLFLKQAKKNEALKELLSKPQILHQRQKLK